MHAGTIHALLTHLLESAGRQQLAVMQDALCTDEEQSCLAIADDGQPLGDAFRQLHQHHLPMQCSVMIRMT